MEHPAHRHSAPKQAAPSRGCHSDRSAVFEPRTLRRNEESAFRTAGVSAGTFIFLERAAGGNGIAKLTAGATIHLSSCTRGTLMEQKCLAVIASPASREGHGSALHRFLRKYREHLHEYEIHATKGTYKALARTGLFEAEKLKEHSPGLAGGVVEIAHLAVAKRFQAIILLLDPTDPFAESPENLALQRTCISNGIPQLMNFGDLAHWIEYEADRNLDKILPPHDVARSTDVVALVAHDGKKSDMLKFFSDWAFFLTCKHAEMLATGTTGQLIAELCRGTSYGELPSKFKKERWDAIERDPEIPKNWDQWLENLAAWREEWGLALPTQPIDQATLEFLRKEDGRKTSLILLQSGPSGGDIQIARRILDGKCNAVLFFHDPQVPHPHDADIRLCIRTCQLPGVTVTLRRDLQSAERWAKGCTWGAKWDLASSAPRDWPAQILTLPTQTPPLAEGQNDERVRQLARACAGYLDELLDELLRRGARRRPRRRVLVLVAWGKTVRWIVEELREIGPRGRYPTKLLVSPMIGLTGEGGKWPLEAYAICHELAYLYGAHVLSLASPAFFGGGPSTTPPPDVLKIRKTIDEFLEQDDSFVVALTTLRPSKTSSIGGLKRYPEIDVSGSNVELSALFLDRKGRPVSARFTPSGEEAQTAVSVEKLRAIAEAGRADDRARRRGEVIVVCGYNESRTDPLAAAIKAGLVNTLVTDTATRNSVFKATSRDEVRESDRIVFETPIRISCRVKGDGEWLQGQLMNMSDSGAFLGSVRLRQGTFIEGVFSLPIHIGTRAPGNVQCEGEVVRETANGVGVRFTSVDDASKYW
jgi:methylglyoxal synthase